MCPQSPCALALVIARILQGYVLDLDFNKRERESEAETVGSVQASPELADGDDQDDDEEKEYKVNLKYSPGKMRVSQYETMMSRKELEEEQRVQRKQLTAIFRLLEENKDTFGEMSDVDVEEQLKLYAI